MLSALRAICALCLLFAPLSVQAQESDAWVLPSGLLRLRVDAALSHFDTRFAAEGDSLEALTGDLLVPLNSRTFAPLRPLETQLSRFLEETGGSSVPVDSETLQLGTPDLRAAANTRVVPLQLGIGLLPRLELNASLPLLQEELIVQRAALGGGSVGLNPAPEANAELLASLGDQWAELGESVLLPTGGSALGQELQRRVQELSGGQALALPDSAANFAALQQLLVSELGIAPLNRRLSEWQLGDLEVGLRAQLLNSLGAAPYPTDSASVHYRVALSLSGRFPTGSEGDSLRLLSFVPERGHTGYSIGLDGDLFLGARVWTTVSARLHRRQEVEVVRRLVSPQQPLAPNAGRAEVLWSPADRLSVHLAPRFRLTEAIALGGLYAYTRIGENRFTLVSPAQDPFDVSPGVLDTPAGAVQQIGFGIRYSTLPAFWTGETDFPMEVTLRYDDIVSAPAREPNSGTITVHASLYYPVWGRHRE